MTPEKVLPDVETKKLALADLVPTQTGTGTKLTVRWCVGQMEKPFKQWSQLESSFKFFVPLTSQCSELWGHMLITICSSTLQIYRQY